ncbi:MAG: glycosyltransferase family 2 protein [Pseudomonadota bacterium]
MDKDPQERLMATTESTPEVRYDSRVKHRNNPPEVSLIIPVFNVADYVAQCLASVFATMALVDLEIIIMDDGSQDASGQMVDAILAEKKPGQTLYLKQSNQGISAVRNRGVSLATGQYIGFLDSDDMLTAGTMRILLDFAENHRCDLVFGKSQVFDSKSHVTYPFYDDWAWQKLLNGASTRVVSRYEDPTLFFLEPNVNYRLIRRDLFVRFNLAFLAGRVFEDPPVHYRMLASAARVGLVDVPYYWYRVNRPGKITAERSRRRFDILEVARETFIQLGPSDIPPAAGSAMVYGLSRIVWWCGTMTLPEYRREYFQRACEVYAAHAPVPWVDHFGTYRFPDEIQHLVVGGLMRQAVDQLVRMSYGRKNPLRSFLFLLKIGRRDFIFRQLLGMSKKILAKFRLKNR